LRDVGQSNFVGFGLEFFDGYCWLVDHRSLCFRWEKWIVRCTISVIIGSQNTKHNRLLIDYTFCSPELVSGTIALP
jgi:hypothetical protein